MVATKARKQPTQGRARATVEAILDAAAHMLSDAASERGVEELSTNAIAARAGVSIGSVYQYFPNKEAIIAALVDHQLKKDHAQLQSNIATIMGATPRPSLAKALEQIILGICEYQLQMSPLLVQLLPLVPELQRESLVFEAFQKMSGEFLHLAETRASELRDRLGEAEQRQTLEDTIFVLTHGLRGALNAAALHDPGRLARPSFQAALVSLVQRTLLEPETEPL